MGEGSSLPSPGVQHLVCVADEGADSHTTPLTFLTVNERNLSIGKFRLCSEGIDSLLLGEARVGGSPELPEASILLLEIAMYDACTEAIDEFVALAHLEGSEKGIVAAANGVGGDNHFLLADGHNLRIHIKRC